ncbi:hypothetical protein [Thermococcus thioreducens]
METMKAGIYPIDPEKALDIFDTIARYGIVGVDVENAASIFDNMLDSNAEKLHYARRILDSGKIDRAVLVLREDGGVFIIKVENVVDIRITIRDALRLIKDFSLSQG